MLLSCLMQLLQPEGTEGTEGTFQRVRGQRHAKLCRRNAWPVAATASAAAEALSCPTGQQRRVLHVERA